MKNSIQQFVFLVLTLLISIPTFAHDLKSIEDNSKLLIPPTITSFSPTSGVIGTTVTINGSNFSTTLSENIVTFNGVIAFVSTATSNVLTVIVPAGATNGAVQVSVNAQVMNSSSVFTVLSTTSCNGISNNNAKHWYFGNEAAIVFESTGPVALTNSAMNQVEGVATMSDANGNLLFYTNGITLYNRNHQIMQNGAGLLSDSSNTQAAFVVPFPGNPNQYFVITPSPYYYSIVDMTLDNGNGAVISTSKNILITNETSEKVAGLLAANQTDIWLITYAASQSRFNTYLITPFGISATPVISNFTIASGYYGYMKISPDQTKIVMANFGESFHLYDFNPATGIVSNQKVINFPVNIGGFGSYGIEFSPNSNLVYVADHRGENRVFQFDITLATPALIANSKFDLASNTMALGALQLGPDNKIYLAREGSNHLGVINQPNVIGIGCQYVAEGVNLLTKRSNLGLPGFVASSLVRTEPYITAFTPNNGLVGTTVVISGINFNTTPSNNFVTFNGTSAVVTAATETSLTVTVPNTATTGIISVAVGCGLVATTNDFTVNVLNLTIVPQTVAAGGNFSLFVCGNSSVTATGSNNVGQLGNGTNTNASLPLAVSGLTDVVAVAARDVFSLFLKSDGTVWATGSNTNGELGIGTTVSTNVPVQIPSLTGIVKISTGFYHSLFLKNDGTVWACGRNFSGEVGNGNQVQQNTPVQVINVSNIIDIAAGDGHSMFLSADGTVKSCGDNQDTALGIGWVFGPVLIPTSIGITNVAAIAAGFRQSIFIKQDGTVWASGNNTYGKLGDGTTQVRDFPVQVNNLTGIIAAAGAQYHTIYLKNDGTVWACGYNVFGQLGDGTNIDKPSPVQVINITNANGIAASGYYHSLISTTANTFYAFGQGGALGIGNGASQNTPTLVIDNCNALEVGGFESSTVFIYPNPSSGILNFDFDAVLEHASLQIIDTSGRIVFTNSDFNSNESINISSLKSGIYIVKINHENQNFSKKVIKY